MEQERFVIQAMRPDGTVIMILVRKGSKSGPDIVTAEPGEADGIFCVKSQKDATLKDIQIVEQLLSEKKIPYMMTMV